MEYEPGSVKVPVTVATPFSSIVTEVSCTPVTSGATPSTNSRPLRWISSAADVQRAEARQAVGVGREHRSGQAGAERQPVGAAAVDGKGIPGKWLARESCCSPAGFDDDLVEGSGAYSAISPFKVTLSPRRRPGRM